MCILRFFNEAFEFGFEIPEVVVIPGFTIPRYVYRFHTHAQHGLAHGAGARIGLQSKVVVWI